MKRENIRSKRCSITGERTLPVLEAAHIKPYAESGPNFISNGLLLRPDMHKFFDAGYLTVTNEYKVEVSKRLKEDYQNGREYYQYHGKELMVLPARIQDKPGSRFIDWHNNFWDIRINERRNRHKRKLSRFPYRKRFKI
jgi:putative restriction endonuclease